MSITKEQIQAEFSTPITIALYRQKALEGLESIEERLITTYFPKGCKVLDIGCGTGRTTLPLVRQGYRVQPIDFAPAMIEAAREIAAAEGLSIPYAIEDATALPYKAESFEAALFSCQGWTQIPSLHGRREALAEVKRVLKPGGVYVFSTHERLAYRRPLFWGKRWVQHHVQRLRGEEHVFGGIMFPREGSGGSQWQYIHIPTVKEVLREVEHVGLEVVWHGGTHPPKGRSGSGPHWYVCRK